MPKQPTFPTLYDNLKTVSISFLTKHGYLKPDKWRNGTINWNINGNNIGSISIQVKTKGENPYLLLDYKSNEILINYKVLLVSTLSNLGKGVVWYFICSHTGKRCRKLYLAGNYFYHRSAFIGCMYEKQTQSKKSRYFDKTLGLYYKTDQLFEQLYQKHFKKQYNGKPTKKYLKITRQIKRAQSIQPHEIEQALKW